MSQQKRPHKRYTPKFFHCDDVPRQTISSATPELVSLTETSLATSRIHSKPEKRETAFHNGERYLLINFFFAAASSLSFASSTFG
jgi:hypothetical protein